MTFTKSPTQRMRCFLSPPKSKIWMEFAKNDFVINGSSTTGAAGKGASTGRKPMSYFWLIANLHDRPPEDKFVAVQIFPAGPCAYAPVSNQELTPFHKGGVYSGSVPPNDITSLLYSTPRAVGFLCVSGNLA